MNSLCIVGNLCKEPIVRTLPSGKKVATIRVAVKRPHSSDQTDFFSVTAWGASAEYLEKYAQKGAKVEAEGPILHREYTSLDGNKHEVWELSANHVGLLKTDFTPAAPQDSGEFTEVDDDELPFR